MGLTMTLLSAFYLANGLNYSVWGIVALRMLHGAACSAIDPLSFSLITDYYK